MAAKRAGGTKAKPVLAPKRAQRAAKAVARPRVSKLEKTVPAKRATRHKAALKASASARGASAGAARPATAKAAKAARVAKPAPARRAVKRKDVARPARPYAAPAESPLNEEERIEAAKYLLREMPKRLFEEERFVFPESYGVTRIRLLIKDPEWLFVHWDVDPQTLDKIGAEMGERVLALTRLTLRIADPDSGGQKTILLPRGARSWYARADAGRSRAYQAELGLTLPSGEFRPLAHSNTVVTPRVGASPQRATRRRRVGHVPGPVAGSSRAARGQGAASAAVTDPWQPSPERSDAALSPGAVGDAPANAASATRASLGGASDAFSQGGASDTHRR